MSTPQLKDFPEHQARPADAPLPLSGIKVIDFTHFIAGPLATMILADMGADVIKVEAPIRGDEFRYYPPAHASDPTLGAPYLWANRNKRSIAVDLKSEAGRRIVHALIADADVVAENFSTGVMERLGLDYATCKALNPGLVYCSVSAYGREGPFADRVGFDPIAQAESGFVSMNGYPDREGVRSLSPVMDISTAMMAANAVLGALHARQRTGVGQRVDLSLFDTAVMMTGYATLQTILTGNNPGRHGNTSPDTCPSGVFRAADRAFYINCGNSKIYQRLMRQVIGRADLADDPVLADRDGRMARREEIFGVLDEAFGQHPWSHWQQRMRDANIPCGEVRTVGEALDSAEARSRGLVSRVPHRTGWMPNVASPIRFEATPMADPVPAPSVGEHTESILRGMGHDDASLRALAGQGIISGVAGLAPQPA